MKSFEFQLVKRRFLSCFFIRHSIGSMDSVFDVVRIQAEKEWTLRWNPVEILRMNSQMTHQTMQKHNGSYLYVLRSICDKCLKPTIRDVFPVVFREFHTEGENQVMFDSYFCVCVCLMHWNHFYRSRREC